MVSHAGELPFELVLPDHPVVLLFRLSILQYAANNVVNSKTESLVYLDVLEVAITRQDKAAAALLEKMNTRYIITFEVDVFLLRRKVRPHERANPCLEHG